MFLIPWAVSDDFNLVLYSIFIFSFCFINIFSLFFISSFGNNSFLDIKNFSPNIRKMFSIDVFNWAEVNLKQALIESENYLVSLSLILNL